MEHEAVELVQSGSGRVRIEKLNETRSTRVNAAFQRLKKSGSLPHVFEFARMFFFGPPDLLYPAEFKEQLLQVVRRGAFWKVVDI